MTQGLRIFRFGRLVRSSSHGRITAEPFVLVGIHEQLRGMPWLSNVDGYKNLRSRTQLCQLGIHWNLMLWLLVVGYNRTPWKSEYQKPCTSRPEFASAYRNKSWWWNLWMPSFEIRQVTMWGTVGHRGSHSPPGAWDRKRTSGKFSLDRESTAYAIGLSMLRSFTPSVPGLWWILARVDQRGHEPSAATEQDDDDDIAWVGFWPGLDHSQTGYHQPVAGLAEVVNPMNGILYNALRDRCGVLLYCPQHIVLSGWLSSYGVAWRRSWNPALDTSSLQLSCTSRFEELVTDAVGCSISRVHQKQYRVVLTTFTEGYSTRCDQKWGHS